METFRAGRRREARLGARILALGSSAEAAYLAYMVYSQPANERNDEAALVWAERAAERGHPLGQRAAARSYLSGRGTPVDAARGEAWLRRAAEAGQRDSMFELGVMLRGAGATRSDPAQAALWLERAAAGGHVGAMAELALTLEEAGTPQGLVEAFAWAGAAERRGLPRARGLTRRIEMRLDADQARRAAARGAELETRLPPSRPARSRAS